jgi:hypothetical protein
MNAGPSVNGLPVNSIRIRVDQAAYDWAHQEADRRGTTVHNGFRQALVAAGWLPADFLKGAHGPKARALKQDAT